MAIHKVDPDTWRAITSLREIHQKLGLPDGFLSKLMDDDHDDWSFIIKICALVETALTDYLIRVGGQPKLAERLSKIGLRPKLGRVRGLGAISNERVVFVERLSDVRNKLAHQIRRIPDFNLTAHVEGLDDSQRKQLIGEVDRPKQPQSPLLQALSRGFERYRIWVTALVLILELEDEEQKSQQAFSAEFQTHLDALRATDVTALRQFLEGRDTMAETGDSPSPEAEQPTKDTPNN